MKLGTTHTSRITSGSNRNTASRKLGSSFQNAHFTSAKIFRRRMSAACARVGALESGFTVEPCATIKRPLCSLEFMRAQIHRQSTLARARRRFVQNAGRRARDPRADRGLKELE